MKELGHMAVRSLWRKRSRSMLTILSITFGVFLAAVTALIGSTGKQAVKSELELLGLNGLSVTTSGGVLTDDQLTSIRKVPAVETAMPLLMQYTLSSLQNTMDKTLLCGIDAGAAQVIAIDMLYGRPITQQDVRLGSPVCVIDASLLGNEYTERNIIGEYIDLYIGGKAQPFEIVGVSLAGSSLLRGLTSYIPGMVYVPYTVLQDMTGRQNFDQIAVRVADNEDAASVREQLLSLLSQSGAGSFHVEDLTAQKQRLTQVLDVVTVVLTAVSSVSLLVAGMGIMAVMLAAVGERTREIGIKKALGAKRSRILAEFLLEAVLLSALGGLIGLLLGVGVAGGLAERLGLSLVVTPMPLAGIAAVALATGIVFGVYPALKASRLPPVDSLRQDYE